MAPESEAEGEMVVMGRISGLYGVKGWVRVFSHTQPRDSVLGYSPWYLGIDGSWEPRAVISGRDQGKGLVARVEGCVDRDQAMALLGVEIAVRRDQLPELDEGDYYWSDLEGLRVVTTTGADLGVVDHLFETGANDVLVVVGERERLIPYLWQDVVVKVELANRLMVVDWDPEF